MGIAGIIGICIAVLVIVVLGKKNRSHWEDVGEKNIQNAYNEYVKIDDFQKVSYDEFKNDYRTYKKQLDSYKKTNGEVADTNSL